MKFLIISHVLHQRIHDNYCGYAPYVREMNIWLKYADEVCVVAPSGQTTRNNVLLAYQKPILFKNVSSFSLLSLLNILRTFFILPIIIYKVFRAMQWADHVHLRCPGNMGLIGCVIQVFFPKKPKTVKYAGNWDPEAQQPFTYKLQKKILSNTFLSRNIKVLVYGEWPEQSKNIVPFFTASFSETEKPVPEKQFNKPCKFLFVGSLVPGKRPKLAIQLIEKLIAKKIPVKLEIYGDGGLRKELEEYVVSKNLEPFVIFFGNKNLETVKEAYKKSQFLILASKSEGWPKAVAEAMFFGCIPIVTSVSCLPWMLGAPPVFKGETNIVTFAERGIIIGSKFKVQGSGFEDSKLLGQLVQDIEALTKDAERMEKMYKAAQQWSQQYTLDRFEKGIREILAKQSQNAKLKTETGQPITHNPQPATGDRLPRSFAARNDTTHNPLPITIGTTTENRQPIIRNPKQLRVLQLIDSLRPGGAERLTVNLANALAGKVEFSAVCTTRIEGGFKKDLQEEVGYIFLNKKSSVDSGAIFRLKNYVKNHKIDFLHAHGTSFFMGCIQKILNPKLKLIWHDHYGESEKLSSRNSKLIRTLSCYFDGIISVNKDLEQWAQKELKCSKVVQLNNFVTTTSDDKVINLKGNNNDFKLICVANLRPQKNHLNLIKAFEILIQNRSEITLHLVGMDFKTKYSKLVLQSIAQSSINGKIFFYGSQDNISKILNQADLGILSSDSEGLPISLLEYGLAGLSVVCTNVGDCKKVVGEFGKLVPKNNPEALAAAILSYLDNPEMMKTDAEKFQQQIIDNYSEEVVLSKFLAFYNEISLNA